MADPYAEDAVFAAMDVCFEAHGLRNVVIEIKTRLRTLLAEAVLDGNDTDVVSVMGQLDFVVDVLDDLAAAMPADVARALSSNDAGGPARVEHPARGVLANMHAALEARERLGLAKGIVMHAAACDADDAFRLLQRIARRRGTRVSTAITHIVEAGRIADDDMQAILGVTATGPTPTAEAADDRVVS